MCRDQAPSPLTPLTLDHPLGQIIAVLVVLGQMHRTATSLILLLLLQLLLLLVNYTNSPQKHFYFSLFRKGMLIAIFLLFPKVWDKQHHCTPPTGHITPTTPPPPTISMPAPPGNEARADLASIAPVTHTGWTQSPYHAAPTYFPMPAQH